MGLIQDFIRKKREEKALKENYAEEQHMVESFHAKKMGANERELLRYQEEERQKMIKQILEQKRKIENDKIWRGQEANPAYTKNVIANHQKLFSGGNMFANTPNVSSQPNVVNQPNIIKLDNIFKRKDNFFKGGK